MLKIIKEKILTIFLIKKLQGLGVLVKVEIKH